jgi:hypothetical protein
MNTREGLIRRLDEIAAALAHSGCGLALIALGSVGLEQQRLDEWSDLDFFAVVAPGSKAAFIQDLDWLERAAPVAYCFQNTADGYKLLFEDGIFCEFAVFEPDELTGIPFAPGRFVWKAPEAPETLARPALPAAQTPPRPLEWLVGEALTNLYVGLCRQRRGERLSALRFIQYYAVDRLLELAQAASPPPEDPAAAPDHFTSERRFERRFPALAEELAGWMQGYAGNVESALAILAYLEARYPVNPAIAAAIRRVSGR